MTPDMVGMTHPKPARQVFKLWGVGCLDTVVDFLSSHITILSYQSIATRENNSTPVLLVAF